MSWIDIAIPLFFGVLLVLRPTLLFGRGVPPGGAAARR